MSRAGITLEEVAQAAFSLEQLNEIPTIEKVRSLLGGTGSYSTISKYLQQWRKGLTPTSLPEVVETPDLVKNAVGQVWQQLRQQTDQEVEHIKAETQRLLDEADQKVQLTETYAKELEQERDELQQAFNAVAAEKEILNLDYQRLKQNFDLLQTRYQSLDERYTDMQGVMNLHFEKMAQQHQKEVERLVTQSRLLEKNQHQLVSELKTINEKERHTYLMDLDKLKEINKKLTASLEKLNESLHEKENQKIELGYQLLSSQQEKIQLKKELEHQIQEQQTIIKKNNELSQQILTLIQDDSKLLTIVEQIKASHHQGMQSLLTNLKIEWKKTVKSKVTHDE